MAENEEYTDGLQEDVPEKDEPSGGIEVKETSIENKLRYAGTATSLHQKTISRLIARRKLSERAMTRRYDSWQRVDEQTRLYIDLTRKAKNADNSNSDKQEMPWARSIVVPMSYAILQVYLTQTMGMFGRRDPMIAIDGVGPEDIKPAKLMNAVMGYDQVQTNYPLELYTAAQDGFKYGMGGFHDCWFDEMGFKTVRAKPMVATVLEALGMKTSRRVWGLLRQFNKVEAWDPYNFFPDPRISLSNLQSGEFVGHRLWRGYLELLAGSQDNGGNYFNVEAIKHTSPKPQPLRSRNRFQASQMNLIGSMDERDKGFHAIDSFCVTIIPEEWELGKGDRPEKWNFTWVDDTVIIRAHPADYDHGQFNYSAFETNIDTHVFGNQGSIENLDGLQRFMNWKYNSHVQNLIRFLNNRMIYAGSLVESFDVENPDAGMHVRLTAQGEQLLKEGRLSIDQMIHQMQLTDVTGPLMASVNQDFDFAMRMSGAADQMMGAMTQEKRTLGEVQRVGQEGSARMSMYVGMMEAQGIRPLALRWASNRQQYTDQDQYVRIAGDAAVEFGGDRVKVRPQDLYGNYDYAPSGVNGMDEAAKAKILLELFTAVSANETIMALPDKDGNMLDAHSIIKEIARGSGIKNVQDFYKKAQQMMQDPAMAGQMAPNATVLPDDQVQQMAQAGNVIPMRGAA